MKKGDLRNIVKKYVQKAAIDELKKLKGQGGDQKQYYNKSNNNKKPRKDSSAENIDSIIFHGGEEPETVNTHNTTTLREQEQREEPTITDGEVQQFESDFRAFMEDISRASITFDTQDNGYSMYLLKDENGIEAYSSGVINLGRDGQLRWEFSIRSGLTIETDQLYITEQNKKVVEKLFEFYDSWQKDWREKLEYNSEHSSGIDGQETMEENKEEEFSVSKPENIGKGRYRINIYKAGGGRGKGLNYNYAHAF